MSGENLLTPQDSIADLLLVAATLGARVARGEVPEAGQIVRAVIDVAIAMVPESELAKHLDAASVARAERLYRGAEAAKFGKAEEP